MRYLWLAGTGRLLTVSDYEANWDAFIESGWQPLAFHLIAITVGAMIIYRGVVGGIERARRLLIPALFILIVISAIRATTLPGAIKGLAYLFTPDFHLLLDHRVWLQSLTQNAWDTGAGWGLILTYGVYVRQTEDVSLNAALIGLGNNSISLLAAITIFSTVFALIPDQAKEIIQTPGPANTGLTFVWIPRLFARMPAGGLFCAFFFLALTLAALSSLISMIELTTRILMDMKMSRTSSLLVVYCLALLCGIPSAFSLDFFLNQDWTWGVGLMLSGAFMALALVRYNVDRFRVCKINTRSADLHVGRWFNYLIQYAIPVQVIVLIGWWFYQAIRADPDNWWNPLAIESVGTCLFQWTLAVGVAVACSRLIVRRTLNS